MNKKLIFLAFICAVATWALFRFYLAPDWFTSPIKTPSKELRIYSFEGYIPHSVITKFESEYKYHVHYNSYTSSEELFATLQSKNSKYDIVLISDYMLQALLESNLIQKLDHSKILNLQNIHEYFFDVPYDKGLSFSIPYTWGTTGFIYNTKHVNENIESLNFFKSELYNSKVSLLEDQREALGVFMREFGFSINSIDPVQIKKAFLKLKELKPKIRLFTSKPDQHILSEDVWIAQIYSGDAFQLMQKNPQLKYVIAKNGSTLWVDSLAIPTEAQNIDGAYAFINFLLEPEVAFNITETLHYATPNKAIQSQLKNNYLKPDHVESVKKAKIEYLKDLGVDSQIWDDAWSQIKSL